MKKELNNWRMDNINWKNTKNKEQCATLNINGTKVKLFLKLFSKLNVTIIVPKVILDLRKDVTI